MPIFAYKGLDSRGKPQNGIRDAESPKALRAALRKDGIFLTEMREERAGKAGKRGAVVIATGGAGEKSMLSREVDFGKYFQRVKPQEVAVFTRQLATLLKAGIPLAEGLAALVDQSDNDKFKTALGDIKQKVNEGKALADSMGDHPKIFPDLYVNMIR